MKKTIIVTATTSIAAERLATEAARVCLAEANAKAAAAKKAAAKKAAAKKAAAKKAEALDARIARFNAKMLKARKAESIEALKAKGFKVTERLLSVEELEKAMDDGKTAAAKAARKAAFIATRNAGKLAAIEHGKLSAKKAAAKAAKLTEVVKTELGKLAEAIRKMAKLAVAMTEAKLVELVKPFKALGCDVLNENERRARIRLDATKAFTGDVFDLANEIAAVGICPSVAIKLANNVGRNALGAAVATGCAKAIALAGNVCKNVANRLIKAGNTFGVVMTEVGKEAKKATKTAMLLPIAPIIGVGAQAAKAAPAKSEKTPQEIADILRDKAGLNKAQAAAVAHGMTESELAMAIALRDTDALEEIRGIGAVLAERIVANCRNLFSTKKQHIARTASIDVLQLIFNPDFGKKDDAKVRVERRIRKHLTPLTERLVSLGGSDAFIETINTVDAYAETWVVEVRKATVNEEISRGIDLNGKRYVFFEHTTNGAKDNHLVFVRRDLLDAALEFSHNGANLNAKAAPAKFAAYGGLVNVWTKEFGIPVTPNQIAFFPSYVKKMIDKVVFVHDDGSVDDPADREVEQNMFDGVVFFSWNNALVTAWLANKSDEEKTRIMRALSRWTDATIRAPYVKGLCVASFDMHGLLKAMNVTELRTVDGSMVDINEIALFADETVFKAHFGEEREFATKDEYDRNFMRLGHRFGRLIEAHADHTRPLCYQHLQMINKADWEQIADGAHQEVEYLAHFQNPLYAANLVGGREMAQVAHIFPSILRDVRWFRERAQAKYLRKYREAVGGRVHNATHYSFIAPDPVAFCQHIAGKKVTGCIPANTVLVCGGIPGEHIDAIGKTAVMSRIPGTDAGALREVTVVSETRTAYDGFFRNSSTYFLSVLDTNVTRFRGDFDGDHCYLTFVKWFVDAVKTTHEKFGDFLVDWDAPSAEKRVCTRKVMQEYAKTLTDINELGSYNILLAKLYDAGIEDTKTVAFLTYAINVLVDASKHGGRKVSMPKALAQLKKSALTPYHVVLSKDAKKPSEYGKEQAKERSATEYGCGTAGRFCKIVKDLAPAELDIKVDDNIQEFNYRFLMFNPNRDIPRLIAKMPRLTSFTNKRTGFVNGKPVYEPDALWQALSYDDEHRFAVTENKDSAEMKDWRRQESIKDIEEYARDHGCTPKEAYDLIVYDMFEHNDAHFAQSKNRSRIDLCWSNLSVVFGRCMVEAALANVGKTIDDLDAYVEDFDEEDDE